MQFKKQNLLNQFETDTYLCIYKLTNKMFVYIFVFGAEKKEELIGGTLLAAHSRIGNQNEVNINVFIKHKNTKVNVFVYSNVI